MRISDWSSDVCSSNRIGDDAGARRDEDEQDEVAPVVGLQKGAQARGVVAGRIHPRAESREEGLDLMRPQRPPQPVVEQPEAEPQQQRGAPYRHDPKTSIVHRPTDYPTSKTYGTICVIILRKAQATSASGLTRRVN